MTNDDLEKYYGDIKEMCNTAGYKALCADLEEQLVGLNSVEYTKDVEDLWIRKGQIYMIKFFLNLENSIKAASEQLIDGDTYA